jgi:hypothetical protein
MISDLSYKRQTYLTNKKQFFMSSKENSIHVFLDCRLLFKLRVKKRTYLAHRRPASGAGGHERLAKL